MSSTIYRVTIYRAKNKINDACYVGVTTQQFKKRKRCHERDATQSKSKSLFHKSLRFFGLCNFEWNELEISNDPDYAFRVLEPKYILENKSHFKDGGYNMNRGGAGFNKHKIPISKKTLQNLYENDKKTATEIAKMFSVTGGSVAHWLFRYNIQTRFSQRPKSPSKKILQSLYQDQKIPTTKISKMFNVSNATVSFWLTKYSIKIDCREIRRLKRPPKKDLLKLYNKELKSTREISKIYGVGLGTTQRWFLYYNIECRIRKILPAKNELSKLYLDDLIIIREIAKIYNVSHWLMTKWLKEYGLLKTTKNTKSLKDHTMTVKAP